MIFQQHAGVIECLDLEDVGELDEQLVSAITALWKHDAIQQTLGRRTEFWVLEAVDLYVPCCIFKDRAYSSTLFHR
jgi:guanine nucleotide-binding protein G(o) subunit alpha/guanine nucleotide-binding protein subunit alpha-15